MDLEQTYLKDLCKIFPNIPNVIKSSLKIRKLDSDEILFHKGEKIEKIYILFSGRLKVLNIFEDGHVYEIAQNTSISFLGEQAVLSKNEYYSVTLKAVTPCVLITLTINNFRKWIKEDIDLSLYLLKELADRLYGNALESGKNSYFSSKKLIINYFIKLYENNCSKNTITLKETQQELSEKIGVSLRSFSRVVSYLKKENCISVIKKKITISYKQYQNLKNF